MRVYYVIVKSPSPSFSLLHSLFSIEVVAHCSHFASSSHIAGYSHTSHHKDLLHIGGEFFYEENFDWLFTSNFNRTEPNGRNLKKKLLRQIYQR